VSAGRGQKGGLYIHPARVIAHRSVSVAYGYLPQASIIVDSAPREEPMRISVDTERCCGAGQCVLAAPEIFDQREEDGIVVLLTAEAPPELYAAVEDAAQICPAGVIALAAQDARS
jgi:ferredoxin